MTGPTPRGGGYDNRQAFPYFGYEEFKFVLCRRGRNRIATRGIGRVREMPRALKIIRQTRTRFRMKVRAMREAPGIIPPQRER